MEWIINLLAQLWASNGDAIATGIVALIARFFEKQRMKKDFEARFNGVK